MFSYTPVVYRFLQGQFDVRNYEPKNPIVNLNIFQQANILSLILCGIFLEQRQNGMVFSDASNTLLVGAITRGLLASHIYQKKVKIGQKKNAKHYT